MSKLIVAVFVLFCFVFLFWGGRGGGIINCTSRTSLTRQMPGSKDRCEEDKWDEKGEKKKNKEKSKKMR